MALAARIISKPGPEYFRAAWQNPGRDTGRALLTIKHHFLLAADGELGDRCLGRRLKKVAPEPASLSCAGRTSSGIDYLCCATCAALGGEAQTHFKSGHEF